MPKILFLTGAVPYPLITGAKIRTFNQMKALAGEFDIELLTVANSPEDEAHVEAIEEAGIACHVIDGKGGNSGFKKRRDALWSYLLAEPFLTRHYTFVAYRRKLDSLLKQTAYDVLHCDSISMTGNLHGLDKERLILTAHNIEQIIWAGYIEHARNFLSRNFYRNQYRKVKRLEENLDTVYGHVVTVSEEDKQRLAASYPEENIIVAENGVDPAAYETNVIPETRSGAVFTGSLDWHPNIDGLIWFMDTIYPFLMDTFPESRLSIVGRQPADQLMRAVSGKDGVGLFADVPDIQPFLHEAKVMIVPLRIGGGSRLKILEAMASNLPVVSTTKGAEGLGLTDGDNIIIRDDPAQFAEAIVALHRDEELHQRIADDGLELVKNRFAWDVVTRPLADLWRKVADA